MILRGFWGALLLVASTPVFATQPPSCNRPRIHLNRYEEDYGFLSAPGCRTDRWDRLKYFQLAPEPSKYLSLGADLRERFEYLHNGDWQAGNDDAYLLHRLMLHGELRLGQRARWFVQLTNNWALGRSGGPRPLDADQLDLHQAFLDVRFDLAPGALTLRAGRQELDYESARLISTRDGANVRLSFDAVRLMQQAGKWRVDAFVAAPVETNPGVFDDGQIPGQLLWGAYAFGPLIAEVLSLDVFYFGFARAGATFDQGRADESRHSFGLRASGQPASLDYNVELVTQLGSFGAGAIIAWTVASDVGYTFAALPLRPRLGLQANVTSGDRDPRDPALQTFNPLFPQASYFSDANLIGPQNHVDVHPAITVRPLEPIAIMVHYDAFWRQSLGDGAYRSSGALIASGSTSQERHLGSELSVRAQWQVDRHALLVASYSHFFAGPFLEAAGLGADLDFFAFWLSYRV